MTSLAVVILTYNEERHIERAIASVSPIASEVFVIDSGSTDATADIAQQRGATVLTHPFVNQAQQFQWALDTAPITADWVMRLDADEVIEPGLASEIAQRLGALPAEVTGVNLKRRHIFMGRWIRHGGRYPLILLRMWRRGKARVEQRWMDEHILLIEGRAVTFDGDFADDNLNDLTFFTDKHNKYATREAVAVLNGRLGLFAGDEEHGVAPAQAMRKRAVKDGVYNRLPFAVGPVAYFLYRYIWQRGFLDGKEGAIYHGLQGLWYRFLVDARLLELERALEAVEGRDAKVARLKTLTGLKLPSSPPR
jgi:glycosyltransferase involved in cell wall biosynthesis